MFDILIKNAKIIDGTGCEPVQGNIWIQDGKVAGSGADTPEAREVIDADGLAVMPGFVDLHTHYDAQITWDPTCSPSPSLGVTTCVMGNCGFGIVPSPPEVRDTQEQADAERRAQQEAEPIAQRLRPRNARGESEVRSQRSQLRREQRAYFHAHSSKCSCPIPLPA